MLEVDMDRLELVKEIDKSIDEYQKMYDSNMNKMYDYRKRINALKDSNVEVMAQIKKLVDKRKAVK
jgi:uncharacterized coiled-coil DUF342 family protein